MPRISLLKTKYRLKDLSSYILGEMRSKNIRQKDMAAALNMTQGNFSQKLKRQTLTAEELIIIFEELETPNTKIGELIGGNHK